MKVLVNKVIKLMTSYLPHLKTYRIYKSYILDKETPTKRLFWNKEADQPYTDSNQLTNGKTFDQKIISTLVNKNILPNWFIRFYYCIV